MSNKQREKKEKFTQPEKKSKGPLIGGVIVLGIAILAGVFFWGGGGDADKYAIATIGETVSYENTVLPQVEVDPVTAENGKVVVTTLSQLKEKKFIYTQYRAPGKILPLTALVQPDGGVVVAVSVCEPCNSDSFRVDGKYLACNACNSIWDIKTFKGISGGCEDFPPDRLIYTQNGDNIEVDEAILNAWQPRV